METTVQVAIIGALFTFFASFLAYLVNSFREYSEKEKWQRTLAMEKEKWQRTLELDERRIKHEENKWALELNSQRELELHKMRLRTYPEIFAALEKISHYHQDKLTDESIRDLADKLNLWGYSEAGLCMLPDTRNALFSMRNNLLRFLRKELDKEEIMHGARQDLIELIRRDLNHSWSLYRNFRSLTDENIASVQRSFNIKFGE
jgi:hypothetical protein